MENDHLVVFIVSIVAVVGIVSMVLAGSRTIAAPIAFSGSVDTSTEATNLKGQAISGGGGSGGLPPACIRDGQKDDVLYKTYCCSGNAVKGSTFCTNWADYGTTWLSCTNICGTTGVTAPACPYGATGTTVCPCPAGTTSNGRLGVGVCQPIRIAYCGDGICNNGETCSTCSQDCGTCSTGDNCTDSDGGIVPNVFGIVTLRSNGLISTLQDSCIDSGDMNSTNTTTHNVMEYYCVGTNPFSQLIQCPNGCSNGACY